ncbi:hypothetical protein GFPCMMHI_03251 [Ensifer adhaerens]|nr:hypothetical protein [Ensifer adhaerens]
MDAATTAPINIWVGKESMMKPDMFQEPVSILVGLGFPAEIRSVTEAYRHLMEWPASSRDPAHSIALKACDAALRGEIEAETVRGLFAAFAEKHDLLAPDGDVIVASRLRRNRDPHVR